MKSQLTDKAYWANHYSEKRAFLSYSYSPYADYLAKYLSKDGTKKCIEIGAFPGGNLGYVARTFGYQPTALDFLDDVGFIKANMEHMGINNCIILNQDFLNYEPADKFDLVLSHGFIEHFQNYEEVIERHIDLLNDRGILFLTVPYLGGFQGWMRKLLYLEDHREKVWNAHNLKIMNLCELERIIFQKSKMVRLFSGFIRGMTIWFSADEKTIDMGKVNIYNFLKKVEKVVAITGMSNRYISPEILIVAKKH